MHQIWKYSLDLGEWKIVNCKNVPQELVTSYNVVTLSGNIIIIYGGIGVPSGGICNNRMYLGNILMTQLTLMMKIGKIITQF